MKKLSKITEIVGLGVDLARLLTEDIKKMSFEAKAVAYFLIDKTEKLVKKRKEEIKKQVMGVVRQKGVHHTEKTRRVSIYGDTHVDVITATRVSYNESKIGKILEERGIDRKKVFVTRTVEEFDKGAWQALIKLGVVSPEEAESAIEEKRSYRLQVKPGAGLVEGHIQELLG